MQNNFSVLSIVGPTATGKTELALELAEKIILDQQFEVVNLISADSRQVFEGIEVLSGADIPADFVKKPADKFSWLPYFQKNQIRLFGVGCLEPTAEWSVSQFVEFARKIILSAQVKNEAVIIVGGTGLYHDHLFSVDPQLMVPPNKVLREKTATLLLEELQAMALRQIPDHWQQMNHSDQHNPRRIIRALEIAQSKLKFSLSADLLTLSKIKHSYLGITTDLETIFKKIEQRVAARIKARAIEEVKTLTAQHQSDLSQQLITATGFQPLQQYLTQQISLDESLTQWILSEKQYVKRQLTWWKKHADVTWFDRSAPNWQTQALKFGQDSLASC